MSDLRFFLEQAESVMEFWGDSHPEAQADIDDYMRLHQALIRTYEHFSAVGYGATFKHHKREQWAFILPDASVSEHVRYQSFDRDAFCGHATYSSDIDVLIEMVRHGYTLPAPRETLINISKTERWRIGSQKLALLTDLNSGKITHSHYLEQIEQLNTSEDLDSVA